MIPIDSVHGQLPVEAALLTWPAAMVAAASLSSLVASHAPHSDRPAGRWTDAPSEANHALRMYENNVCIIMHDACASWQSRPHHHCKAACQISWKVYRLQVTCLKWKAVELLLDFAGSRRKRVQNGVSCGCVSKNQIPFKMLAVAWTLLDTTMQHGLEVGGGLNLHPKIYGR